MDSINKKNPFTQLIFPVLIQATIACISLIIIIQGQIGLSRSRDTIDLKTATDIIQEKVVDIINTGRNIEALYKASQEVTMDEFNEFASVVINGVGSQNNFLTMQWVDEQNYVRYVYPLNGDNQKAVGFNNNLYPNRLESLIKAKNSHSPVITEPLILIQGYPGMIIYVPIFKDDIYLGAAVSIVKLSDIFSINNIQVPNPAEYQLITDNIIYPFSSNNIYNLKGEKINQLDGSTDGVKDKLLTLNNNQISQDINILNNDWKIETQPYNLNNFYSTVYMYWLAGLIITYVFGILIYKVYSKQTQLALAYIGETKLRLELEEEVIKRKIAEEVLKVKNRSLEEKQEEIKLRNIELEKVNKAMVDREIKMTVLKKELEELKEEKIKKEDKPPI